MLDKMGLDKMELEKMGINRERSCKGIFTPSVCESHFREAYNWLVPWCNNHILHSDIATHYSFSLAL